jgi:hypothetical protein
MGKKVEKSIKQGGSKQHQQNNATAEAHQNNHSKRIDSGNRNFLIFFNCYSQSIRNLKNKYLRIVITRFFIIKYLKNTRFFDEI